MAGKRIYKMSDFIHLTSQMRRNRELASYVAAAADEILYEHDLFGNNLSLYGGSIKIDTPPKKKPNFYTVGIDYGYRGSDYSFMIIDDIP